jgi:hypothetical protein
MLVRCAYASNTLFIFMHLGRLTLTRWISPSGETKLTVTGTGGGGAVAEAPSESEEAWSLLSNADTRESVGKLAVFESVDVVGT